VKNLGSAAINLRSAVNALLLCGGSPGDLPIAQGPDGSVDMQYVRRVVKEHGELWIASLLQIDNKGWESAHARLRPNVVLVDGSSVPLIQAGTNMIPWPTDAEQLRD